jgi:hypothetical protein
MGTVHANLFKLILYWFITDYNGWVRLYFVVNPYNNVLYKYNIK